MHSKMTATRQIVNFIEYENYDKKELMSAILSYKKQLETGRRLNT
jgi:hypothetical protein